METNLTPKETLDLFRLEFSDYDFESRSRKRYNTYIRAIFYSYSYKLDVYSLKYVDSLMKLKRGSNTVKSGIKLFKDLTEVNDPIMCYLHDRALNVIKNGFKEHDKDEIIKRQKRYIKNQNIYIKKLTNQIKKHKRDAKS